MTYSTVLWLHPTDYTYAMTLCHTGWKARVKTVGISTSCHTLSQINIDLLICTSEPLLKLAGRWTFMNWGYYFITACWGGNCMNENLEKFFKTVTWKTYQRDKNARCLNFSFFLLKGQCAGYHMRKLWYYIILTA